MMCLFEYDMLLFENDMPLFGNDMFLLGNELFLFGDDICLLLVFNYFQLSDVRTIVRGICLSKPLSYEQTFGLWFRIDSFFELHACEHLLPYLFLSSIEAARTARRNWVWGQMRSEALN